MISIADRFMVSLLVRWLTSCLSVCHFCPSSPVIFIAIHLHCSGPVQQSSSAAGNNLPLQKLFLSISHVHFLLCAIKFVCVSASS